jgi:hypothetical protein
LIPETVSTGIIFVFTTSVYIICTIFILLPLYSLPSPSHQCQNNPPRQNLFYPVVLQFCRRKNIKDKKRSKTFLLVGDKDSYKGGFLVCFHVYMNICITTTIGSSPPVLFTTS